MTARPLSLALLILAGVAPAQDGYRRPPRRIVDVVTAAPLPRVSTSTDRTHLLVIERESMPSIEVLSRPILRLAGRRIDPATHGPQRRTRTTAFTLVSVADGTRRPVEVPAGADLGYPVWTADGSRFAFTNTTDGGIELWVCDVEDGTAARVPGVLLNATMGSPVQWMPDQETLLCRLVVDPDAPAPEQPRVPAGPRIQESGGEEAPVRTYQDLLQNAHDEALFEHYMTSQLALVDPVTGAVDAVGEPALVLGASPSPDGELLLRTVLQRPFSYLVPAWSFPRRIAVVDRAGREVLRVADLPLAEEVPIGGVREGPRSVQWLPGEDRTLVWVEALDGGDPRAEVPHRDELLARVVGEDHEAVEWQRLEHRYAGLDVAPGGELALLSEYDRDSRRSRTWKIGHRATDVAPDLLIDRSVQDAYGDPGDPVMQRDGRGDRMLHLVDGALLLRGRGATPQGERPFLDAWDLATKQKRRLFESAPDAYEQVEAVVDDGATRLLIRHETADEPPSWHEVDVAGGSRRAVLALRDPLADLLGDVEPELLHYERDDGLDLSGKLYTPPDWDGSTRLPLLVWAYPREYTRAGDAGQVRGSTNRYQRPSGTSPLLLMLVGYAVLDDASMPIVGPTKTANDTFVDQLVANAKAAIEAVVARGVADPDRVAIAGHSYGAFMTANLLAHSDLFRAGIARSGAYNRSLTPFGFQREERTFWEAPEIYFAMSPFMHADDIDEPLLLIHGEADNNSGTFPLQSKRLYHAVKGNGGIARLVMLPFESHGYRARESVLHVLAETVDWLDRWVADAEPRPEAAEAAGSKGPRDGGR